MLKKLKTLIILIIALSVGYFFVLKSKQVPTNQTFPGQANKTEVNVLTVKKQNVQLFIELPARVSAYKTSEIRPQVEGIITQRNFTEGSIVEQGQQLYQIDPTLYKIAVDNAIANLKALSFKAARYQTLLAKDAISKQEYDDIEASFKQAQAEVSKAETNLTYTKVLAPISGYIGKSNITEGALVTANQALVLTTITQLDPIYVDMTQPTKDIARLNGQDEIPVSILSNDLYYQELGVLKFSEMFVDESTDSIRLRAIFPNADKKLLPGMFVNAKLHLKPIEAIAVPQKSTSRAPDGSLIVFVVDSKNIVKARPIKADEISGDSWVVKEGLEDGETIVYEGLLKIADGAEVKPVAVKTE
jgi:membrane fusion protein (multidrug efflux system)